MFTTYIVVIECEVIWVVWISRSRIFCARIQDLYFNISEMKLSIISLYIISDAPEYDIIWTENSDVIDSFIPEILKYESLVIQSLKKQT